MFHKKEHNKKLKNRLNYISGQCLGIIKMIDAPKDCHKIYLQLTAIKGGTKKLFEKTFEDKLRMEVNIEIFRLSQNTSLPPQKLNELSILAPKIGTMPVNKLAKTFDEIKKLKKEFS